jgi:hypothetical protein
LGRRTAVTLVVAIALVCAISGCSDQSALVLRFTNNTDRVLNVAVHRTDTGVDFDLRSDVKPGETAVLRGDLYPGSQCSESGVLIARDTQGAEVARKEGRTCPGDTWVVGQAQSSDAGAPSG